MTYTRNVRRRPRYLTVAHMDTPQATLRDVEVPEIVPLYVDFKTQVGIVRLRRRGNKIFAIVELNWNVKNKSVDEQVFLGWDNCTKSEENGVCYLDGGQVTCASFISKSQANMTSGGKQ